MTAAFWRDRNVLVTGHTGFKGGWLVAWLQRLGARVTGYALEPSTTPSLFHSAGLDQAMCSVIADVRDRDRVADAVTSSGAEVVFHLAAQPLVRVSYAQPVETFATNVMGTVHVLESVRNAASVRAVVVVTTDKCYEDQDSHRPYVESDRLGGFDPYANSKACAELVTRCYRDAFLASRGIGVATARGGNVLGGGDWTRDRLVPDILAACASGSPVRLRRPGAIRPWQHVLDLLSGYLELGERLFGEPTRYSGAWNFGPDDGGDATVDAVARRVVELWGHGTIEIDTSSELHESATLRLDSSKARAELGWRPRLTLDGTLQWTVAWQKAFDEGTPARELVESQIKRFEEHLGW